MNRDNNPIFFDNVTNRVIDDIKTTIRKGSKLDIAAASFSIYAYQLLRSELEQIEELSFFLLERYYE